MDGELRHLKEEAYRLKNQTEEKLSVGKDLTNEIEQLQNKIDRAKDINLVLQKSIRRAKKTKSKLSEEVSYFWGGLCRNFLLWPLVVTS